MTIEVLFSEKDIEAINEDRERLGFSRFNIDKLLSNTKKNLEEIRINKAKINLIKRSDGKICWGSERIPIKVMTEKENFVIKNYDVYDAERERNLLMLVQGKIAPKIIYFGESFYAEEFVDHERSISLDVLADSGNLNIALKKGAEMHAELAKLSIDYNHNHWLDEFHTNDERNLIIDFGTSIKFFKKGENKNFDKKVDYLEKNNIEDYFEYYGPIPCLKSYCLNCHFYNYPESKRVDEKSIQNKINALSQDEVTLVNLMGLLQTATIGIKKYIESKAHSDPWELTIQNLPEFLENFSKKYKEK